MSNEGELREQGFDFLGRIPCPAPGCSALLTMVRRPDGQERPYRAILSGGQWKFAPHEADCADFGYMAVALFEERRLKLAARRKR